jgi:hypothetical protein
MRQWRTDQRAALHYDDANYERPELAWAQRNPIQPQAMVHDLYLYDRAAGRYTVDRYLADLRARYGGIDSVLLWPTYPNIGVDDRNTDQMIRDLPGGIDGLRQVVADFHRAGVEVLFPIHPWDVGTRDPGKPWSVVLAETMAEIAADGLNGDTMRAVTEDFFTHSVTDGRPLVLEPEIGLDNALSAIRWNVQSWGYWNVNAQFKEIPFPHTPQVSLTKWLEPRYTVHANDRWSTSKIDMLQAAFFNGTGLESWENVWGIWNQLTDRDCEAIRRIATIERTFAGLLVSQDWEPHTPTLQHDSVVASKWPGTGCGRWSTGAPRPLPATSSLWPTSPDCTTTTSTTASSYSRRWPRARPPWHSPWSPRVSAPYWPALRPPCLRDSTTSSSACVPPRPGH